MTHIVYFFRPFFELGTPGFHSRPWKCILHKVCAHSVPNFGWFNVFVRLLIVSTTKQTGRAVGLALSHLEGIHPTLSDTPPTFDMLSKSSEVKVWFIFEWPRIPTKTRIILTSDQPFGTIIYYNVGNFRYFVAWWLPSNSFRCCLHFTKQILKHLIFIG